MIVRLKVCNQHNNDGLSLSPASPTTIAIEPASTGGRIRRDWIDTMSDSPPGLDARDLPRAGFWRRCFALFIDGIIVMLPFGMLAAVLFAATAGMIQMNSGLFTSCADGKAIPQGLNPPPPHDSNFMRVCRVSFFGATTGATLTVGRVAQQGATTTTVSQSYMLDKEGSPIGATSIDWIYQLAFVAYLVVMVWKTGKTLGARAVRIRVIDVANPGAPSVPLGRVIGRYLAMLIGAAPLFALLIYQYAATGGSADAMFTGQFFQWFTYAGVLGAGWAIVVIGQMGLKIDPVYDRLAGTAVVLR
jgi:hypothetical protein